MSKLICSVILLFALIGNAWAGGPWFVGSWEMQSGSTQENAQILDYTFRHNGTFSIDGVPPLRHEGKYKVAKHADELVELTVVSQKGDMGNRLRKIVIQLNSGGATITINGKGPFYRLKPVPPGKLIKVSPQD